MTTFTIIISVLICAGAIGTVISKDAERLKYKYRAEILEQQYELLSEQFQQAQSSIQYWYNQYEIAKNSKQSSTSLDRNVKEALRFAMIQSHPDKPNGSNELFIKYRETYKKYCK